MAYGFKTIDKVAKAAIVDTREDFNKVFELYKYWAARGLDKVTRETIRNRKKRVSIKVNKATRTAPLPCDCRLVTFVGVINDCGKKIPLRSKTNLAPADIEKYEPEQEECKACGEVGKCSDAMYQQTTKDVIIDGITYQEETIVKLLPNGEYMEEVKRPVKTPTGITYWTQSRLVTTFELNGCGCIATTAENEQKVQSCCSDAYSCYWLPCQDTSIDYGGFQVFDDLGYIMLDKLLDIEYLYVEYVGFLPKVNGEMVVPDVAFECLVAFVVWKAIESKSSVPMGEKLRKEDLYDKERKALRKILTRTSIHVIYQFITGVPDLSIGTGPINSTQQ